MASIDPYIVPIPQRFLMDSDPEVRAWFEYDNLWKHSVFEAATDGTGEYTGAATDLSPIEGKLAQLNAMIAGLSRELSRVKYQYQVLVSDNSGITSVNIASSQDLCDNTFNTCSYGPTLTFPQYPKKDSVIIIRNFDGGHIKLIGNGKSINGSSTGSIRRKGTCIEFFFSELDDMWVAR